MLKALVALIPSVGLVLLLACGGSAEPTVAAPVATSAPAATKIQLKPTKAIEATTAPAKPASSSGILQGVTLAKIDIKDAIIEDGGPMKGTLTIAQHFGLSPKWVDPQDHIEALTMQHYDFLIHDAMFKNMPQGLMTYSLAEHAEVAADWTKAGFRLRPGLKFHDGSPLTTEDVAYTYKNYRGVQAKYFHDLLDDSRADGGIEVVDDLTIIYHFNTTVLDFLYSYNGAGTGIGWIVPSDYYEKVGPEGFKKAPIGAGPFKFISQDPGATMEFDAWGDYWRRKPGVAHITVRGIRDGSARLAGLKTGELDLAYGVSTAALLPQVVDDPNLRWDPNFTYPWLLFFPNWEDPASPFNKKEVRQAVSLAINRRFAVETETMGIGIPSGDWTAPIYPDSVELPVPEYNPEKAKQLLADAGYPDGFEIDGLVPFVPYFSQGERYLADLAEIGIRGKLVTMEGPSYRAARGKGRDGYEGNSTILHSISGVPGVATHTIRIFATCDSPSSFICTPEIEELWKKWQSGATWEERNAVSAQLQKIIIENYYAVPIFWNPFVHAIGPRVLPEGDGFHKYWDTDQAPYPYPWEVWEVKP